MTDQRRLFSSPGVPREERFPPKGGPPGISPYSMLYKAMKAPHVIDSKLQSHQRTQQKPEALKIMGNDENYKMIKQLLHGLQKTEGSKQVALQKRRDGTSIITNTMTTAASSTTYQRHQRSTDFQQSFPSNLTPPFPSLGNGSSKSTLSTAFNGRRSSFGKKRRTSRQHAPSLARNLKKPNFPPPSASNRNASQIRTNAPNRGSQSTISTSGIISHPRVNSQTRRPLQLQNSSDIFDQSVYHGTSLFTPQNESPIQRKPVSPYAQQHSSDKKVHLPGKVSDLNQSLRKGTALFQNKVPSSGDNDFEYKLEKALIDLAQIKNQVYNDSRESDNRINRSDKKGRTFYGGGGLGARSLSPGRQTFSSGFRPTTSTGQVLTPQLQTYTAQEIKERLTVAQTIMKKLYKRNKELEQLLEIQGRTTSNSGREPPGVRSANVSPRKPEQTPTLRESSMPGTDRFSAGEETFQKFAKTMGNGWIESTKTPFSLHRQQIDSLTKELDEKNKRIFELEQQLNQKYKIDSSKYNSFLQARLKEHAAEAERHLNNYMIVRNTYNRNLIQRIQKDKKRFLSDIQRKNQFEADIFDLKKSLRSEREDFLRLRTDLEEKSKKWEKQMREEEDEKLRLIAENARYIKELENRNQIEEKVNVYVKKLITHNEQLSENMRRFSDRLRELGVDEGVLAQALADVE